MLWKDLNLFVCELSLCDSSKTLRIVVEGLFNGSQISTMLSLDQISLFDVRVFTSFLASL